MLQLKTLSKSVRWAHLEGAVRLLSAQAQPQSKDVDWESAKPFQSIPTQSLISRDFLPGGVMFNKPLPDINAFFQKKHGNIVRIPSLFRRPEMVFCYDPDDFEKVYRTEGPWPYRLGLESISYWRQEIRTDIFTNFHGLVTENGEKWKHYRTIINPVMMQPKTVALYVPKIDDLAREFVELTRSWRDDKDEAPANFGKCLQNFAFESVGIIALDRRLNVLDNKEGNVGRKLADSVEAAFDLSYQLDFLPSLWKYIKTPTFKNMVKTLDEITKIVMAMVEETVQELGKKKVEKPVDQQSVLEKLLKIDTDVAMIMAFDTLVVGIDTTSSAIKALLYLLASHPEKQQKLRQEILTIMPEKDTPLTAESIKNLPYLRACMKEQHRLIPVTFANVRGTGQDLVLQGYQVPAGTNVVMQHGVLSMNEQQFGRPKEFIPERWLKDESMAAAEGCPHAKKAHSFTYMPFGFGNRACIGMRFADLETALLAARMVRNFEMSWHYGEPQYKPSILNNMVSDLKIRLKDIE